MSMSEITATPIDQPSRASRGAVLGLAAVALVAVGDFLIFGHAPGINLFVFVGALGVAILLVHLAASRSPDRNRSRARSRRRGSADRSAKPARRGQRFGWPRHPCAGDRGKVQLAARTAARRDQVRADCAVPRLCGWVQGHAGDERLVAGQQIDPRTPGVDRARRPRRCVHHALRSRQSGDRTRARLARSRQTARRARSWTHRVLDGPRHRDLALPEAKAACLGSLAGRAGADAPKIRTPAVRPRRDPPLADCLQRDLRGADGARPHLPLGWCGPA